MEIDVFEKWFCRCNLMRRARIWTSIASESYWLPKNQSKSSFRKSGLWLVVGCGEFETDQDLSRNSISRLVTNENREIETVVDCSSFDAQISNMSFISLGFRLVREQPMGIEFWNVEWPSVTEYGGFKFDFCLMVLLIDQSRVPLHVILRGMFIKWA